MIQQSVNQIIANIGYMSSLQEKKEEKEASRARQEKYLSIAENRDKRASEKHELEMQKGKEQLKTQKLRNKSIRMKNKKIKMSMDQQKRDEAMQVASDLLETSATQVSDFKEHMKTVGGKANG